MHQLFSSALNRQPLTSHLPSALTDQLDERIQTIRLDLILCCFITEHQPVKNAIWVTKSCIQLKTCHHRKQKKFQKLGLQGDFISAFGKSWKRLKNTTCYFLFHKSINIMLKNSEVFSNFPIVLSVPYLKRSTSSFHKIVTRTNFFFFFN